MKYVGINKYSVIWNIMDITRNMIYAVIKLKVFVHLVANTALHMKHLIRWRDVYGNKWSLFITKMIVDLVVKEQYSLMIIFYQRNITFELRAENGPHYTYTHVTGCICDLHFANVSKIDPVPNA